MFGLGTIINTAAIVVGGLLGIFFGRFIRERHQETLSKACGVSVLFIGIAGALAGMLKITESGLTTANVMMVVLTIALGALVGEILNIEGWFERFGSWLMKKTGSSKDKRFVEGFVAASLTVCVGAMAVVGSVMDGISGDYSILAVKAVLDFVIEMVCKTLFPLLFVVLYPIAVRHKLSVKEKNMLIFILFIGIIPLLMTWMVVVAFWLFGQNM